MSRVEVSDHCHNTTQLVITRNRGLYFDKIVVNGWTYYGASRQHIFFQFDIKAHFQFTMKQIKVCLAAAQRYFLCFLTKPLPYYKCFFFSFFSNPYKRTDNRAYPLKFKMGPYIFRNQDFWTDARYVLVWFGFISKIQRNRPCCYLMNKLNISAASE